MRHSGKFLAGLGFIVFSGVMGWYVFGGSSAAKTNVPFNKYAPEQPIAYSHKLHAGDLEIPCQFCHTYARRSRQAGIPALEQCMSCHNIMGQDKEGVKQVVKAFEANDPIRWVKVHDLPDFVYFSHKPHIRAGFECQECHGPVESMDLLYREADMTMGWCVRCHKENVDKGASLDCWVCHK